jgi:hypothetical protein
MKMLTQKYLKECLDYDPDTGLFTWKERPREHFKTLNAYSVWNSRFKNTTVGRTDSHGYRTCTITIDGISFENKLHRLAWLYIYGEFPEKHLDHIDGNRSNNKFSNLREADFSQNQQNLKKATSRNKSSGMLGVSWIKRLDKYRTTIGLNLKNKIIGHFNTPEEAHQAYIEAKRRLHEYCTL